LILLAAVIEPSVFVLVLLFLHPNNPALKDATQVVRPKDF
jgi:hypothetical protein